MHIFVKVVSLTVTAGDVVLRIPREKTSGEKDAAFAERMGMINNAAINSKDFCRKNKNKENNKIAEK